MFTLQLVIYLLFYLSLLCEIYVLVLCLNARDWGINRVIISASLVVNLWIGFV